MDLNAGTLLGKSGVEPALEAWCFLATWAMIGTAVPVFLALIAGITAPYGRYVRSGWGIFLNARVAWLVSCMAPGSRARMWHVFGFRFAPVTQSFACQASSNVLTFSGGAGHSMH